jgi:GNAT superfamily N-acetyltransferase
MIRPAVTAERLALEALQWRASLMLDEYRQALLAHPDAIQLPLEHIVKGRTLVAEINNRLAGFAVVLPRDDGDHELDGLFVEPALWRNGVGKRLVQAATEFAASRGAMNLYVVSSPFALDFYAACSFHLVGETQTRFGVARTMRKALS